MSDLRYVGNCIVIAAITISGFLFSAAPKVGRFQYVSTDAAGTITVLDTLNGEFKTHAPRR